MAKELFETLPMAMPPHLNPEHAWARLKDSIILIIMGLQILKESLKKSDKGL
jgi:hypothetical protein